MDDNNQGRSQNRKSRLARLTYPNWATKTLVFMLIVVSLLVIVTMGISLLAQRQNLIKKDQYQAVFLSNGQVYFGKLRAASNQYVNLKDVFYLQQNQQQVQQPADQSQQNNLSLVRLGNELHGPENEMFIDRDQILFWENLKEDGKVVQAIKGNQVQP